LELLRNHNRDRCFRIFGGRHAGAGPPHRIAFQVAGEDHPERLFRGAPQVQQRSFERKRRISELGSFVRGEKRRIPADRRVPDGTNNTKGQLASGLQILLGRALTRMDIEYDNESVDDEHIQATCTLHCIEESMGSLAEKIFKGEVYRTPTKSKGHAKGKDHLHQLRAVRSKAEHSAAVAAYAEYKEAIELAIEAHQLKKTEKAESRKAEKAERPADKAVESAQPESPEAEPPAKRIKTETIEEES